MTIAKKKEKAPKRRPGRLAQSARGFQTPRSSAGRGSMVEQGGGLALLHSIGEEYTC